MMQPTDATAALSSDSPERAALRLAVHAALKPPAVTPSMPPAPKAVVRREETSPLTASDKLERLVDKGLDRLDDVLSIEPSDFVTEEGQLGALRVIVSAIEKVLNTQVRVDGNRLKQRQLDAVDDILKDLDQAERRLPKVPLLDLTAE